MPAVGHGQRHDARRTIASLHRSGADRGQQDYAQNQNPTLHEWFLLCCKP